MVYFRYGLSKVFRIDFTIVILLGVVALGMNAVEEGEVRAGILLILVTCILLVPLYVNARLLASRIGVDSDAITWSAFGFRWRTIPWPCVKRIRRLRSYNIYAGRVINTYCVDQDLDRSFYLLQKGPIVFDETIKDFDKLLSLTNKYAADHHIQLVAVTDKQDSRLDNL